MSLVPVTLMENRFASVSKKSTRAVKLNGLSAWKITWKAELGSEYGPVYGPYTDPYLNLGLFSVAPWLFPESDLDGTKRWAERIRRPNPHPNPKSLSLSFTLGSV